MIDSFHQNEDHIKPTFAQYRASTGQSPWPVSPVDVIEQRLRRDLKKAVTSKAQAGALRRFYFESLQARGYEARQEWEAYYATTMVRP
jgi:hypothetical protein